MTQQFSKKDCAEIFYATSDARIAAKIGVEGTKLYAGLVKLTPAEAALCYFAVNEKLERIRNGEYDDFPEQVMRQGTVTERWATHLEKLAQELMDLAQRKSEAEGE
jgi:ethanolamine utilization microcompartment shell protein EutS